MERFLKGVFTQRNYIFFKEILHKYAVFVSVQIHLCCINKELLVVANANFWFLHVGVRECAIVFG